MARARKEAIVQQNDQQMNSSVPYSTGKSTHPMNRAMDLLEDLWGEIPDDIYTAATVALTNEPLQVVLFVRMSKRTQETWLSKLKPLE
jgi:hypothetical protein